MFHVLDHAAVVFSGELSQATQYVIEHYGQQLDEAIRSGIKIAYTDSLHRLNGAMLALQGYGLEDAASAESWKQAACGRH